MKSKFNNNDSSDKDLRSQQIFYGMPGRDRDRDRDDRDRDDRDRDDDDMRQGPPGMEQPPRMSPPGLSPGGPGADMAPRSAPPSFVPEGPGMDRRGMERGGQGQVQYGFGSPGRDDFGASPREMRRCLYRFTYFWLFNGNNFWFYPTYVDRQFVYGFRWRRNRWEYDRINLRRIFFFRCF